MRELIEKGVQALDRRSRRSRSRPGAVAAARARRRVERRQHVGRGHAAQGRHVHDPRQLGSFGVADPAQNYTLQEWQLLIDTHDGLVQFKRVGGAAGTQIVPDLATAIPDADRRRQDLHLPASARGSSSRTAQTLKPSDFVTTFERQFTVPGPTVVLLGHRRRGQVQAPRAATCRKGVVADDSRLHADDPPDGAGSRVPRQAGAAVRVRRPGEHVAKKLTGNNVPPGTGPYMWKSYDPNKEAVLVRNPYFKVWNADAQPDGLPGQDRREVRPPGLRRGDRGRERPGRRGVRRRHDPVRPAERARTPQYADQTHVNALTADWYFALNTQTPPFNNLKARQAINFAVDRGAYVKIAGGSSLARADLPDPAAELPRLRAVLPVHRQCDGGRHGQVDGARPAPRPSSWSSSPARPGRRSS